MTDTDKIEKELLLRAPKTRVWRALSDAEEFGSRFGMKMDGPFEVGHSVQARMKNPKYEHLSVEFEIERMDPEDFFSYRWHPYAMDANIDYSKEPTTLVEFQLEDAPGGTLLRVIESGFDQIPAGRRAEAFGMNSKGWSSQVENIRRYVED